MRVIKIDILRFWKNILGMTIRSALPLGATITFMYSKNSGGKFTLSTYAGVYKTLAVPKKLLRK